MNGISSESDYEPTDEELGSDPESSYASDSEQEGLVMFMNS